MVGDKQPTQPRKKGAKPIEIPVPERDELERLLSKAAKPLDGPARGASK